jgi:hypothetical protein
MTLRSALRVRARAGHDALLPLGLWLALGSQRIAQTPPAPTRSGRPGIGVIAAGRVRADLDELAARAAKLETSRSSEKALVLWLRECVAGAHEYRGVTTLMMAAIEDTESALHASCVTMRAAGTRLLARAQAERAARADIDGTDLCALIGALAWLSDQPLLAPRAIISSV